ncbi:MAG: hypothetical protein Fur0021_09680 [Candidatus Promineifilaceae bacterium]
MTIPAKILLLEDDPALLNGIADLLTELKTQGYEAEVTKATNGQEGIELLRQQTPDLIISDIMMPVMNGLEFLKQVRQKPDWLHIPLIFLTAKSGRQDFLESRTLGAELFIPKPFDPSDLLALVKSQLDRTLQLQQVRAQNFADLKDNILLVLSHEFRTPLGLVTMSLDLLAEGVKYWESADTLQNYLEGIQTGYQRMTRLVNDLITIIELRTGEAAQQFQAQAAVIRNVSELFWIAGIAREEDAHKHQIRFHYNIPRHLPPIWGVPDSLDDIFRRLIDNAIRFTAYSTKPNKDVYLTAFTTDAEIHFQVADNGIGLPGYAQEKIFELFYQHNRQQLEQQGSGAGLTIVKGLVELHGGRIEVQSQENAGTIFTVRLPICQGSAPGESAARAPACPEVTILVAEDDYYLLQGLRDLLEYYYDGPYKFQVLTATNGLAALEILNHTVPDLIISDVMMPKMDGFELLAKVRANPDWIQIPFIFLTARGDKQDVHHGRSIGAEEYIAKPYETNDLLTLITTQLNRHFAVQSVLNQNFTAFKRSILDLLQPDVRLPLDLVHVYSQQLTQSLQSADSDSSLKASLQGLRTASQQLAHLVENFITLAEIKTGEAAKAFNYRAGTIEGVGALFYLIVDAQRDRFENKHIAFHFDIQPNLPIVFGDSEGLERCLEQLVRSGSAACQQVGDGALYFAARAANDELCLSMRVVGSALPAADAARLSALFRGDDDAALTVPIYGPALTVAKGIIDLHKGRIEMDNDREKGCTFTLILPSYQP